MKVYKATGSGTITIETMEPPQDKSLVKVKISQIMLTHQDLNFFKGAVKTDYPHALGSIATGIVSDDRNEYGLKRGTKVIIDPYECEINDRLDLPSRVKTCGLERDGLLSDFVYLPIEKITPFPEDVQEEEAIFTVKIATAMETINSFRVSKGDYMVIIGGNSLCNILAQLAMYFQLIPIVVDNNEKYLKKMEANGIYYTINSTKEVPYEKVMELTGGRMAEHTVYEATSGAPSSFLFSLAKDGGDCTVVSENKFQRKMEADLNLISRKQLRVKGVSSGASEIDSAINILAQKIINFDDLIDSRYDLEDVKKAFLELEEAQGHTVLINLI
ncbi:MAG: zinc-binding dehydrogenase [Clostridiales bacterium]|nr:zinc-binding dehydrogenase [Clostridiales bacterium]